MLMIHYKQKKKMKRSRVTRSMARSNGIDIEVMYIEAIQNNKSKRKIDLGENERTTKKRKIETKPAATNEPLSDNQIQKKRNSYLVPANSTDSPHDSLVPVDSNDQTNEMAQSVTKNDITQTVARIEYKINEVVFAKIKGYPHWPAKIKRFDSNKMVTVVWFNDYRTTKIYKTQLSKFLVNFERLASTFDQHIGLKKAAHEGLIYFGCTMNA